MSKATLIKDSTQLGAGLQLQRFVHYHHGGEDGDTRADMVLENLLRVLHPEP